MHVVYIYIYVYIYMHVYASGGKTAPAFCTLPRGGWGGWGDGNLRHTRMLRHVLGLGVGGVGGDVNVHVNLRQTRMLRHVLGLGVGG